MKLLARVHVVCATKIQMNYDDKTIPVLKLLVLTSHPNDRFSSGMERITGSVPKSALALGLDFAKADVHRRSKGSHDLPRAGR